MIVVEGPDGAGKTTLVQYLKEHYKLHVGTRGVKDRDLLYTVTVNDTMRALGKAVRAANTTLIWDRLYYSDFVYAPIQERPIAFNASQQTHVDRVLDALRCPIIVCLPPFEVVEANAAAVHQMPGVDTNIAMIYYSYEKMVFPHTENNPVITKPFPDHRIIYDYTDPTSLAHVLAEVEDYLDERKERQT